MISTSTCTKNVINQIRNEHFKGKDPQLVEKIIMALSLLEFLTEENVEFIFKGGTCLLILLPIPHRFSIDLDVVVARKREIIEALENICKKSSMFTRVEEDIRPKSKIPKAHYKVFYKSNLLEVEAYVLVDLIEDSSPYPRIQDSEIKLQYCQPDGPYKKVKTPTINGALGDKMTALAARTTGINLGEKKDIEIAKQFFDVATLFDYADNFEEVRESFISVAEKEIKYRGGPISCEDVLIDLFSIAKIIAYQGTVDANIYRELESGIKKLRGYIFKSFNPNEIHIAAAKVAYLSQVIRRSIKQISRYNGESVGTLEIRSPDFSRLNKMKKSSSEGFYYWKQAVDLFTS